jgi:type I restriction enzyme M protein
VLFGSTTAHVGLRKILVENQKLDAIVKLPSGVFKPYAGVSTAIVFFTKTNAGGTDDVWFYEVTADGFSLDDKRAPLLADDKRGPRPASALDEADHARNNLPDVLLRWNRRGGSERERPRTAQSFTVPKADIVANNYDLSLNRYKEIVWQVTILSHFLEWLTWGPMGRPAGGSTDNSLKSPKDKLNLFRCHRVMNKGGSRRYWTRLVRCS